MHYNQCIKENKVQTFKSKVLKLSTGEFSKGSSLLSYFFYMEVFTDFCHAQNKMLAQISDHLPFGKC